MPQTGFYEALRVNFAQAIPHARECGMVIDSVEAAGARASMPYRDTWLGDTERGVFHTGVITTLVDTVGGVAAVAAIGRFEIIATLDLRMDFLRPARQGLGLNVQASCFRLTRSIAFVRASAWQDDESQPVAVAHATFMRGSPPGPK